MKSKAIVLSTSILISLLLGESMVRFFHVAPELIALNIDHVTSGYKSSSNPILGYELKANYRNTDPFLHYGDFSATNSHGQRDIERTYEKPTGLCRIILLGDSVVAGHGIQSVHNTISRELEKLMQKDCNVEVLNLGVGGYQTLAEAELLRVKGVKYAPDVVVLVFEESDFNPENNDMWCIMEIDRRLQALLRQSQLFRFIAVKTNLFTLGDFQRRISAHRAALNDSVEKGIGLLKALSLGHNFDLCVVIWPRFSDVKKHVDGVYDFYPQQSQIDNVLRIESICKKNSIDSYRLVPYFIDDYNGALSMPEKGMMPSLNMTYTIGDSCHPNVYGSRVAAQGLQKILYQRKACVPHSW